MARILGVPLHVSPAWLLIAVVLVALYAPAIGDRVPGIGLAGSYAVAAAFVGLLLVSVLLHEIGHALAALRLGVGVTGMTLWMLGGFTELEHEPRTPGADFLVAAAGPAVSFLLGGVGLGALAVLPDPGVGRELAFQFAFTNLAVAVFNLLPGLPLDGGQLVRAGVWRLSGNRDTGTVAAGWGGRVVAVAVICLAAVSGYLGASTTGLLLTVLVGAFLWTGASRALRSARLNRRLPHLHARALARPALLVPADLPLAEATRRAEEAGARAVVVCDAAGTPTGIVSGHAAAAVPAARRPWVPVSSVARSTAPGTVLPAHLSGEPLLRALQAHPAPEYLVVDDDRVVGVVVDTDVAAALQHQGSLR